MGSDAFGADEPLKERPGVQIFKVQTENGEAAVAKVSFSCFRYDQEVRDTALRPSHKGGREGCLWGPRG